MNTKTSATGPTRLAEYVSMMESIEHCDLATLQDIVTADVYFSDPFNDTRGTAAYVKIIEDMRENLANLRIEVTHVGMAVPSKEDIPIALLRWRLSGDLVKRSNQHWQVIGCSELRFAADGRIEAHIDYWDAAGQLYEKFPLVGSLLRWLRKRIRVDV